MADSFAELYPNSDEARERLIQDLGEVAKMLREAVHPECPPLPRVPTEAECAEVRSLAPGALGNHEASRIGKWMCHELKPATRRGGEILAGRCEG